MSRRFRDWVTRTFAAYPGPCSALVGVVVAVLHGTSDCVTYRGSGDCAFTLPGQGSLGGGVVAGVLVALGLWLWSWLR